jgi:phospholipid/cholesterol/gamma-HCH transport system permease protein
MGTPDNPNEPHGGAPAAVACERPSPDRLVLRLAGAWRGAGSRPGIDAVQTALQQKGLRTLQFDTAALQAWDFRLVAFVNQCAELALAAGLKLEEAGLPDGVRRLLRLAAAVPEKKDARRATARYSWLYGLGETAIQEHEKATAVFTFLGETALSALKLARGKARIRKADVLLAMQQCGPQALGIVAMINFLVGLILAFVGAVQLTKFGAAVYVADLVAIGTVREMACIMTGIILCGRTGAAFAAQLGTMKVNQEISALQTFGISPIEFLVLPRMLALMLMMPLLCVFADLISIAGGLVVSVGMLDVTTAVYLQRTMESISLASFLLGVAKGSFFGFLVAFTGCLRGMQCGNNAAAVGQATTRAVVAGISSIVASDGIFAVLCHALNL